MKAAVQLEVLRRKAQHINILRPGGYALESLDQVVAVVEVRASRAFGQIREGFLIGESDSRRVLNLHGRRGAADGAGLAGIATGNDGVKTARIQRADNDIGADGAVHDFGPLRLHVDQA